MEKEIKTCKHCEQPIFRRLDGGALRPNEWRHVSTAGRGCKNTYAEPK